GLPGGGGGGHAALPAPVARRESAGVARPPPGGAGARADRGPGLPRARRYQGAGGGRPGPPRDDQDAPRCSGCGWHGRRGGHPRHRTGRARSSLTPAPRSMAVVSPLSASSARAVSASPGELEPNAPSAERGWFWRLTHPNRTIWPTRDGWWCLFVVIGLGVAAINTGNNLLYLLVSLLLALIIVSGMLSELAMRGVELVGVAPDELHAGEPAVFGASIAH